MIGEDFLQAIKNKDCSKYQLVFSAREEGQEILQSGIDFLLEDNIDGWQIAKLVMTTGVKLGKPVDCNILASWLRKYDRTKSLLVYTGIQKGVEKIYCPITHIEVKDNTVVLIFNI